MTLKGAWIWELYSNLPKQNITKFIFVLVYLLNKNIFMVKQVCAALLSYKWWYNINWPVVCSSVGCAAVLRAARINLRSVNVSGNTRTGEFKAVSQTALYVLIVIPTLRRTVYWHIIEVHHAVWDAAHIWRRNNVRSLEVLFIQCYRSVRRWDKTWMNTIYF